MPTGRAAAPDTPLRCMLGSPDARGRSKGVGFVRFSFKREATAAIAALHNQVCGQRARVAVGCAECVPCLHVGVCGHVPISC